MATVNFVLEPGSGTARLKLFAEPPAADAAPLANVGSIGEDTKRLGLYVATVTIAPGVYYGIIRNDADALTFGYGCWVRILHDSGVYTCEVSRALAMQSPASDAMISGTVDTVINTHTPTTTEFQADDVTEATADHYKDRVVFFTSGVLADQFKDITAYSLVGGIGQFTTSAFTEAPANNDTFVIV